MLAALAAASAVIINSEITRTIDLSTSIAKVGMIVKADGVTSEGYDIALPSEVASHLAFISVEEDGKKLQVSPPVEGENKVTTLRTYPTSSSPRLKVTMSFVGASEPRPKQIHQNEDQFLTYTDNVFATSPYRTKTQKTTVKLASPTVLSYTEVEPTSIKSTTLTYGPYTDIDASVHQPMSVHFKNNKPFAKMSSVVREFEVSQYGNVAVEEVYELKHAGAELEGGFSRIDYSKRQRMQGGDDPSFRTLRALLPRQTSDLHYRDQIGNISTSAITFTKDATVVDLDMRFPLMGGWKTQFYLQYNLPSETMISEVVPSASSDSSASKPLSAFDFSSLLSSTPREYSLKFDAYIPFDEVWVEDLTTKVVLPEGATNCRIVSTPSSVQATVETDVSNSRRFTYLDSSIGGGKPVINIRQSNLVPQHHGMIEVRYTYVPVRMLLKPALVFSSFLALFLTAIFASRLDLSLGGGASKKSTEGEKKM